MDLILKKEEDLDNITNQVCQQEAEKMAVFRLINDEKPTRAMISLEKKLGATATSTNLTSPTQTSFP